MSDVVHTLCVLEEFCDKEKLGARVFRDVYRLK